MGCGGRKHGLYIYKRILTVYVMMELHTLLAKIPTMTIADTMIRSLVNPMFTGMVVCDFGLLLALLAGKREVTF